MFLETLKALLGPEIRTDRLDGLRSGRVIVTGVVREGETSLRSPIRRAPCVAYFYYATYHAPSRGRSVTRPIREAVVYAPSFSLEMEGGAVVIRPDKSADFDEQSHQALTQTGLPGFKADEQLIRTKDRIEVHGKARREGDGWVIIPTQILLKESAAGSRTLPTSGAKRRKKE